MSILLYALAPVLQPLTLPDMSSLDAITRQLPQGVYTTFRTFDGKRRVIGLRQHLERLYGPLEQRGLTPRLDRLSLRCQLAEALSAFPADEARVRLVLTWEGEAYLALQAFTPLPAEVYAQGVSVVTVDRHRENPALKSTAFIQASQDVRLRVVGANLAPEPGQTQEKPAFEALLTHNGRILEGLTSNFFYVQGGVLGTARRGILPGVTRRLVLYLARRGGVPLRYRALPLAEIASIEEAFLTSSSRGVVPIVQIDGQPVGEGRVGEVTRKLSAAYEAYVHRKAESIL